VTPGRENRERLDAERQHLYARSRQRDMAEVAHALKNLLSRTKANQKAFSDIYRGTTSGDRLRRGLARLLADDREALAFFDDLIVRRYT
jgi:hypothetical protein